MNWKFWEWDSVQMFGDTVRQMFWGMTPAEREKVKQTLDRQLSTAKNMTTGEKLETMSALLNLEAEKWAAEQRAKKQPDVQKSESGIMVFLILLAAFLLLGGRR